MSLTTNCLVLRGGAFPGRSPRPPTAYTAVNYARRLQSIDFLGTMSFVVDA